MVKEITQDVSPFKAEEDEDCPSTNGNILYVLLCTSVDF